MLSIIRKTKFSRTEGSTVVTSLEHKPNTDDGVKATPLHEFPQIQDAGQLVGDLLSCVCDGFTVGPENKKILESLIWPFVAFRSITKNYYNAQKRGRLVKSLRMSLQNILEITDPNYRQYAYVKYWLGVLMCKTVHDDVLPVKKDWITRPLFMGYCRRVLSKSVYRQRIIDLELIQSLVKGSPKIWLILPEAAIQALDDEYEEQLDCSRDDISIEMIDKIKQCTDRVCRSLIGQSVALDEIFTASCPSAKACKQRTIKENGSLGLYTTLRLPKEAGVPAQFFTAVPGTGARISRPIVLNSEPSPSEEELEKAISDMGTLRGIGLVLGKHEKHIYQKAMQGAYLATLARDFRGLPESNSVRVGRVYEAGGKVRFVSCGCGYTYTALRPLQMQLISCWKSQKESSMLQDDLTTEVNRIHQDVKLPYFVSGDYKAATNLEKRQASHIIMAHLKTLGVPLSDLGLLSFGPGTVEMPPISPKGKKRYFTHREGQLMGHVLSFPLLCIVNLAVYQRAIDLWLLHGGGPDRTIRLTDGETTTASELSRIMRKSCKINGDDILFKSDHDLHRIWVECAKDVGFILSIGKSYVSEHFGMMNSQFYHLKNGTMVRVGYLNLPLVLNTPDPDGEPCTPFELGGSLNRMLKDLTIGRCAIKPAIENCERNLGFSPYNYLGLHRYWFGPLDLGGYGIDRKYAPEGSEPSRDQRMLAAIMRNGTQGGNLVTMNSMSPKMLKIFQKYLHPRENYDPYCRREGEVELPDCPWFSRLLVYNQYSKQTVPKEAIRDPVTRVLRTFRWDYRLHPMSTERYLSYTSPQVFHSRIPVPPKNYLSLREMDVQRVLGKNADHATDLWLCSNAPGQKPEIDPKDPTWFNWYGKSNEECYSRFKTMLQ